MTTQNVSRKRERGMAWRNRRAALNRSQTSVAKQIGVASSTLCNWEYGKGTLPTADQQIALAKALGYPNARALMEAEPERPAVTYEQTFRPSPAAKVEADLPFFAKLMTEPDPVFVTLTQGDTFVSVKIPGKLVDVFARVLAGGS